MEISHDLLVESRKRAHIAERHSPVELGRLAAAVVVVEHKPEPVEVPSSMFEEPVESLPERVDVRVIVELDVEGRDIPLVDRLPV